MRQVFDGCVAVLKLLVNSMDTSLNSPQGGDTIGLDGHASHFYKFNADALRILHLLQFEYFIKPNSVTQPNRQSKAAANNRDLDFIKG